MHQIFALMLFWGFLPAYQNVPSAYRDRLWLVTRCYLHRISKRFCCRFAQLLLSCSLFFLFIRTNMTSFSLPGVKNATCIFLLTSIQQSLIFCICSSSWERTLFFTLSGLIISLLCHIVTDFAVSYCHASHMCWCIFINTQPLTNILCVRLEPDLWGLPWYLKFLWH